MRQTRIAALALLVYFCNLNAAAQTITLQEATETTDDWLHDLFQPVPGQYIAINYADPHGAFSYNRNEGISSVALYDAKLKQTFTGRVKALAGKKYQGGIELDKHLYVFYSGRSDCLMDELDPATGQLTGNPISLFNFASEPMEFIKGFSDDSSFCYALFKCATFKSKDEIFQGVIMNRAMKVVTRFSFPLPEVKDFIDKTICTFSNDGQLFIINAIRVKPSKNDYRPLQYLLTGIDKQGKTNTNNITPGLPEGRLDNIVCTVMPNGFKLTGFLAKTDNEGFATIFSAQYDNESKKIINPKQTTLSTEPYWKKLPGKKFQDGKQDGIPSNAKMTNYFKEDNGDITMVMQQSEETYVMHGNTSHTDYFGGSIFVVRIRKTGEPLYIQFIPLYQAEATTPTYAGYISLRNNNDLCILYYDMERNQNVAPGDLPAMVPLDKSAVRTKLLIAASFRPDGSKISKIVTMPVDSDARLAPHQPFAIYNGEVLYTSYEARNAGKSKYKPGIIKIR